jgi:hypothetical protein
LLTHQLEINEYFMGIPLVLLAILSFYILDRLYYPVWIKNSKTLKGAAEKGI